MELSSCSVCGEGLVPALSGVRDPESGELFSVLSCTGCGLGHTSPRPEDLGPYYGPVYYGGRHGLTARYCVRRRLAFLRRTVGTIAGKRLLDVGCGEGDFLAAAREAGADVYGIEPGAAAERARQRGLSIGATLRDAPGSIPYDAITLWHSLEHVADPRAALERVAALLAPAGVLLCAVPDAAGLPARLLGRRWLHLDVPRHLHHYGRTSMERLLALAAFRPLWWVHQELEYDMLGWMEGAMDFVLPSRRVLFRFLATRRPPLSMGEMALAAVSVAPLAAAALPLSWSSAALRRGGTLVVAARRA